MKKSKVICLIAILILNVCLLSGCKGENGKLEVSNVTSNTLLIKGDGKVQAAFVEGFEKEYYDKEGLNEYIQTQVKKFQEENGEDSLVVDDFEVADKKAKVILTFKDMDAYSKFNSADSKIYTIEEAKKEGVLPDTFVKASDSSTVNKSEIENGNKYKVMITKEVLDIKVEGLIQYYSSAVILNNKTVQTIKDKETVIVFE